VLSLRLRAGGSGPCKKVIIEALQPAQPMEFPDSSRELASLITVVNAMDSVEV
jgi:hypothetical protein